MRHRGLSAIIHRIGIKYCGGCNPRYDRVEAVGYIRRNLPHGATLTRWDDENADIILVVTGCKASCADRSGITGKPVRELACEADSMTFIDEIRRGRGR